MYAEYGYVGLLTVLSNSYKDIKIGDYVNRIMISTIEIKFVVLEIFC